MALKYRSNSGTTTRWVYDLKPSIVTSLMYMVVCVMSGGCGAGARKSVHDASASLLFLSCAALLLVLQVWCSHKKRGYPERGNQRSR